MDFFAVQSSQLTPLPGVNWARWRERPRIATSVLARLAKETDGIKKTLDLLCQMQQQEAGDVSGVKMGVKTFAHSISQLQDLYRFVASCFLG